MSYFLDDLNEKPDWNRFVTAWRQNRMAHAVAFEIPEEETENFLRVLQNFFLERDLLAPSPPISSDIYVIGDPMRPPGIDSCRYLAGELSLFPRSLEYRVGIICHGDALSPAGAHSLLKITEEPPEYSFLVFLHSGRPLLPTLESRVWSFSLHKHTRESEKKYPFLEGKGAIHLKLKKDDQAFQEMEKHLLEIFFEKGWLTKPLFDDMFYLIAKEDYSFGEVFDNIW